MKENKYYHHAFVKIETEFTLKKIQILYEIVFDLHIYELDVSVYRFPLYFSITISSFKGQK